MNKITEINKKILPKKQLRPERYCDQEELTLYTKKDNQHFAELEKKVAELLCQDFTTILKQMEQDFKENEHFRNLWLKVSSGQDQGSPFAACVTAVRAYSMDDLYKDFNQECRQLARNGKTWEQFPYKAWFLLLMLALLSPELNAKTQPKLDNNTLYYRGVDKCLSEEIKNLAKTKELVFCKTFKSTSINRDVAEMFAKDGTLIIYKGIPEVGLGVKNLSAYPSEEEVLIGPWNTYKVVNFKESKTLGTPSELEVEFCLPDDKIITRQLIPSLLAGKMSLTLKE